MSDKLFCSVCMGSEWILFRGKIVCSGCYAAAKKRIDRATKGQEWNSYNDYADYYNAIEAELREPNRQRRNLLGELRGPQ